jgi:hypothetical protein
MLTICTFAEYLVQKALLLYRILTVLMDKNVHNFHTCLNFFVFQSFSAAFFGLDLYHIQCMYILITWPAKLNQRQEQGCLLTAHP